MEIQWYPGHMTKARRAMKEDIKLVDLIIEVTDARIPYSSRNPDIDEMGRQKSRVILLNKADLANEAWNDAWVSHFQSKGFQAVKVDSRNRASFTQLKPAVLTACREKLERDKKRGILNRPVRAMVVGIPNVGKSTFINSYAGKSCAKTGNKPGVTKANQWIRLNKTLELLDTPGILWPRFESREVGLHLALVGSINDDILDGEELALELIALLRSRYPELLKERYGEAAADREARESLLLEESDGERRRNLAVLEHIAQVRGCLLKAREYDWKKASGLLLDDYRKGRLGRITLEFPPAGESAPQSG